jgi:hypothetical protein
MALEHDKCLSPLKGALNVNKFVTKVTKCKQGSILTSIQNTKSQYNCTNCQKATEAKK